jgi:hypothetical protein
MDVDGRRLHLSFNDAAAVGALYRRLSPQIDFEVLGHDE